MAPRDSRLSVVSRTQPAFTLATFASKDFIVKDFIEELSESALPSSTRRSQQPQPPAGGGSTTSAKDAFDPKPLIRTFENTLSKLGQLSEELTEQETDLSGSVRRAEAQHNANVSSLSKKLEQAIQQFNRLDGQLSGGGTGGGEVGGSFALRTGERLEELERQHKRAQDAKFLIVCWMEVSEKNTLGPLEDMRRSGGSERKVRCASIAQQLLKISHRLDPEQQSSRQDSGAQKLGTNGVNGHKNGHKNGSRLSSSGNQTRETIERFLESLETDLLDQFDDHRKRQNYEGMKECASALRDFNEGASVMASFVNQHSFFLDKSQLVTDEVAGDDETWARIGDPDAEPPGVEPGLQALIDEVKLVVQDESFDIKRAFPYYDEVLTRFLQRVFQQSIQQRLEMVLQKAESVSSLAFLRTLQASRNCISGLVDDLKSHGLTEHPEAVSSQISAVLDQQLDELFVPYLVGSSYIEREKKSLEELYSSLLLKFTIYHSRRQKKPTTYLDRLGQRGRQLMDSARDAYMDRLDSSELSGSNKAMLLRIAGVKADAGDKQQEIEITEQDGKLNLATAKRMLRWLAEGVGRGLELSSVTETPKDVQQLLNLLLTQMGEIYLNSALEAVLETSSAQKISKLEPELDFLPSLRTSISILHLLQTSITTMLLPLATSNVTVRRDLEKTSTSTLTTLETKISTILHETLDATISWLAKLLAAQKKTDFRPRDEDLASAIESTPTCANITTFLTKLSKLASLTLDGANLSSFLAEVATALRTLLLEHLRKFIVSLTGGLVVSSDVTKYSELVKAWPMKDTAFAKEGGMEILVEVANMFVIGPEALRERLRPSAVEGGGREAGELRRFVERREDVASVGVQAVLSSL